MEISTFIEHFAAQFDETDTSEFKPETRFRDTAEWSSLIALSVMAMIDEEYDVTIKGAEMHNSQTIEELFNIVKSKK